MEFDIKVVESLKEGRGIKVLLVDGKEESATFLGEDKYELVYSVNSAAFADTYVLKNRVDLILMEI